MPTPEEIKKIAREFAEYSLSEEKKMYDDETYQRLVDEASKGLFDVRYILQWLCKTHCIVEKSMVINEHRENKEWQEALSKSEYDERFDQCRAEGAIDVLESIFGTELFNEEKE